jgi:hypothetical protein
MPKRDVEPSSEDKVVVHELQNEDTQEDNSVIIISEDTGRQEKSLQLKQESIDPIEQGESAKDSPLEHVCQDREREEEGCS